LGSIFQISNIIQRLENVSRVSGRVGLARTPFSAEIKISNIIDTFVNILEFLAEVFAIEGVLDILLDFVEVDDEEQSTNDHKGSNNHVEYIVNTDATAIVPTGAHQPHQPNEEHETPQHNQRYDCPVFG
jgi:hypothetical protein